jgi:hypothetical protein
MLNKKNKNFIEMMLVYNDPYLAFEKAGYKNKDKSVALSLLRRPDIQLEIIKRKRSMLNGETFNITVDDVKSEMLFLYMMVDKSDNAGIKVAVDILKEFIKLSDDYIEPVMSLKEFSSESFIVKKIQPEDKEG